MKEIVDEIRNLTNKFAADISPNKITAREISDLLNVYQNNMYDQLQLLVVKSIDLAVEEISLLVPKNDNENGNGNNRNNNRNNNSK